MLLNEAAEDVVRAHDVLALQQERLAWLDARDALHLEPHALGDMRVGDDEDVLEEILDSVELGQVAVPPLEQLAELLVDRASRR